VLLKVFLLFLLFGNAVSAALVQHLTWCCVCCGSLSLGVLCCVCSFNGICPIVWKELKSITYLLTPLVNVVLWCAELCTVECLHGKCERQRCICEEGWTGARCDLQQCDRRCARHGYCNNGTCDCRPGRNGRHCSLGIIGWRCVMLIAMSEKKKKRVPQVSLPLVKKLVATLWPLWADMGYSPH